MGSGVDQSRLNSSSPSSPGGKGGGSSSPQQASSQPSSPGGKGGGGGYSGSSSPMVAEEYPPSSPGGKGGGPSTFNSFPDPRMGRGASPGGKGGGGYGPDDRFMPQQQYQQPFQQQFGQQQPQRPAFLDNPEYQGYQKQAQDLNNQLNDYTKQSPIFQQLQDLQGKLRGFESPQQQQTQSPPNEGSGEIRTAVMPQEGTPEYQQRMQNIMGLYTPDYYQQQPRGMTMDMPQRYGRQQQLPQYGQSGLGISQLGNMANMLRGNPMQQMQRQNTYQNPYQSQLQAAQQFNMQRANMANQQQRQLAQQYQRQQSQMSARKALEQAQGQYDFGSGAG